MAEPFTTDSALVAARWRPLTEAEALVAETRLGDAGRLLLAQVPSIPARVADGSLEAEDVHRVQAEMVLRVMKNPLGVRQETTSLDDYTHGWTRDNSLADGRLHATEEELAALLPARTGLRIGTAWLGIAP